MKQLIVSLFTAAMIAGTVLLFTVRVLAPALPPFVGPPDIRESKSLKLPVYSMLRLSNVDGSLQVYTHPEDSGLGIEIEADIMVYLARDADRSEVERFIDGLVEARGSGDLLEVIAEPSPRPPSIDMQVDFTIYVPRGTDVEALGANGNVRIAEGCGNVTIRGVNSDIEILQPEGAVVAQNTNGRIRVMGAASTAKIDSINGSIIAAMRGGELEATSLNGNILARVEENSVRRCDLESENGGITVVLADDSSATVEATTDRGFIRSDFAFGGSTGVLESKQLNGTLGEGGTKLTIETLNGNIWVAKG